MLTNQQKAALSLKKAVRLLREKPQESALVERYFLLDDAWEQVRDLPQPLQQGEGLAYVLARASLPIEPHDLLLGRFEEHIPTKEEEERLANIWPERTKNPITRLNFGHTTLDFAHLTQVGIVGYIKEATDRLERAISNGEDEATVTLLRGMLAVYVAIRDYIERYGQAADKAGLHDCADVCRALTEHAPSTFREALQLCLFIYIVYLIYAGDYVACLTFGRMDDFLLPLYQKEISSGTLTREDAGAFIDDFSCKTSLHIGRGEHQMANPAAGGAHTGWDRNPVYDSPGYIVLGGRSNHGDHRQNPLTLLFAEHIHPLLKNPIYICRHAADSSDALWDILCQKARDNASLLLYNDETVIPAYRHIGVEECDAVDYSVHPCNWADIGGGNAIVGNAGGPLPLLLNEVLGDGTGFTCMDDVYHAASERYAAWLRPTFEDYRARFCRGAHLPAGELGLTDCFMPGVIERAHSSICGGVKYPALYISLCNIGTAADMLSAIETLVWRDGVCTLPELVAAAADNFTHRPDLLARCRHAPKYGTDSEAADAHAVRLMRDLLDVIDREATNEQGLRDVLTLNVTINDMNHLWQGGAMAATVDGRLAGAPLSENLSPTVGYAQSVTQLLNSVAKLPFDRIHSGALNVRLRRDAVRGEAGLIRLKALIETYFEQGGMQLQVSIADTDELRRAQQYPENYGDLLVRITGYSAIFVDMSPTAQEEFIRRDELG